MSVRKLLTPVLSLVFITILLTTGCVERKLTINTDPSGALVSLNDEEIGTSPVSVGFEWYGDYNVRISKEGYQTLTTSRNLKRPIRDRFPFDLFDDIVHTRIDAYSWDFELKPFEQIQKDQLIQGAVDFRKQALADPNGDFKKPVKPKKPKSPKK